MVQQIVNKWRQILPHGILEQTGVLLWVMSVMVIGLRLTLTVPDQPIFLRVLQLSVTTLTVIGICGAVLSASLLILNMFRLPARPMPFRVRRRISESIWWNKRSTLTPSPGSLVLFTVDTLLAAMIVRTAIKWAERSSLDAWQVMCIIGFAAIHITLTVLHEHRFRS